MSRFFLKIENGNPSGHPMSEENFVQVYPNIDMENLPAGFALYTKVAAPEVGVYEKNQKEHYVRQGDGNYKCVWVCEGMTDAEKTAKQNEAKALWASMENTPDSWTFNEDTCWYDPPSPYPNDGNLYRWDEASLSWIEESE